MPDESSSTGWLLLLLLLASGLCEVCYAPVMARTDGFARFWPTLYCACFMALSLYLLSLAMRTAPVGTAYAVWVGVGAVGTALYGMVFLGESAQSARIAGLGLIVAGVAGLKLFGGSAAL